MRHPERSAILRKYPLDGKQLRYIVIQCAIWTDIRFALVVNSKADKIEGGSTQVFDRLIRVFAGTAVAVTLTITSGFAQAPAGAAPASAPAQPKVKDQGEYDALTAASKETDLMKKQALLQAWQDKYPDSEFKNQRLLAFMDTWSKIAAKGLQPGTTPDGMGQAKDAANKLLTNLDAAFSPDAKPAAVTDDQWKQARGQIEQQAHLVLGYVALQAKDYPGAEAELKKYIALNDQNAQVAYWLGASIAGQKDMSRYPEALYQYARAISISGTQALPPDGKKSASDYLQKAWNGYHGDDDAKGLQDLNDLASKSAMPPADFTIKSVVQREKEKAGGEEAYLAQHPDIKLWRDLKATLIDTEGQAYFDKSVKGAIIPQEFNGKIVTWKPDEKPTEVTVSIDDPKGDALIKYEKPLNAKLVVGQAVKIKGYALAFQKDPFMMTFSGENSQITGIAAEKAKPAARKPVARKHK